MRKGGFTLIELLIIIIVIGVMAAIAIPGFSRWGPDMRLKGAVRDLKSAMELSKLKAIRQNANVALTFDTGTNSYTVFVDNGAGGGTPNDWIRNGTEEIVRSVTISSDVTMYDASFAGTGAQCRFDSRGLPNPGLYTGTESDNHVYLRSINKKYRGIWLNIVGLIEIKESTNGANWTDAD